MKTTKRKKAAAVEPMVIGRLSPCKCGKIPKLVEIGEWPAQYQVQCSCGKIALGDYYGSHDRAFRHSSAKKSAIKYWEIQRDR